MASNESSILKVDFDLTCPNFEIGKVYIVSQAEEDWFDETSYEKPSDSKFTNFEFVSVVDIHSVFLLHENKRNKTSKFLLNVPFVMLEYSPITSVNFEWPRVAYKIIQHGEGNCNIGQLTIEPTKKLTKQGYLIHCLWKQV